MTTVLVIKLSLESLVGMLLASTPTLIACLWEKVDQSICYTLANQSTCWDAHNIIQIHNNVLRN